MKAWMIGLCLLLYCVMIAGADEIHGAAVPVEEGAFSIPVGVVVLVGSALTLGIQPGNFLNPNQIMAYMWQESADQVEWFDMAGGTTTGGVRRNRQGQVVPGLSLKVWSRFGVGATVYLRLVGTYTGQTITLSPWVEY